MNSYEKFQNGVKTLKTTGSDLLISALKAEGVDVVFGIAGDHILHILDNHVYA